MRAKLGQARSVLILTIDTSPSIGVEMLTPAEIRTLESESWTLRRPLRFALLGNPRDRSVQWCEQALGVLTREAHWAPEADWAPGSNTQLRFRDVENSRWTRKVVERCTARTPAIPHLLTAQGRVVSTESPEI